MKRAVLIGINYPNTDHALRGCVNDVKHVRKMLIDHFEFDAENINMLTDHEATTANMLRALEELVAASVPGDIVFFQFSGHGSQVYDSKNDGDYEADGLDEILCPMDLNWRDKVVRDDDLKRIFDKLPNGVHFTVVLDCCNSGSGMDHDTQYQPIVNEQRSFEKSMADQESRYLPPPAEMISEARARSKSLMPRPMAKRNINKTGMMISGCRADQTSADAYIGGRYIGACTHFLTTIIKERNYCVNYKDLIEEVNRRLARHGFTQRPELNGPESMYDFPFISCHKDEQGNDKPHVVHHKEEKPHGFWQKIVHFFTVTLPSLFK